MQLNKRGDCTMNEVCPESRKEAAKQKKGGVEEESGVSWVRCVNEKRKRVERRGE